MWSVLLMGLAGLLVGGAISFHQQKKPRWVSVSFAALAVMSLAAAYLLTLPGVNQPALGGLASVFSINPTV